MRGFITRSTGRSSNLQITNIVEVGPIISADNFYVMVGDDCEPQGDTHLQDISPRALQVADEESFGLNEISHLAAHRCTFFDCDTITITSPRKPQDENLKSFTSRETEFLAFCHPYVRFFLKKILIII